MKTPISYMAAVALAATLLSVPAGAEEPAQTTPAAAPKSQREIAEILHAEEQLKKVCAAMRKAIDAVAAVKTLADAETAAEALKAGLDAVDAAYAVFATLPPEAVSAAAKAHRKETKALGPALCKAAAASMNALSEQYFDAVPLIYQLYVRRSPFVEQLMEDCCIMEGILSMDPMDEDRLSAGQKRERDAAVKEAAGRHADFVAKHAETYSGGDGNGIGKAIRLSGVSGDGDAAREAALDYLRVVYPVVDACFVGYQAHPDGKQYLIYNLYTGIFRDDDGRMRFRVTPIWFCVQGAPAPEKK
ncbi:MAG: hypothetical protein ACI4OX_09525 [Akkermansia sp.]